MRSTDLAPLLQQQKTNLGMRQGTIYSFNTTTGENWVKAGGSYLQDLPILNSADAVTYAAGDIVALLRYKSTYFILGRIIAPGGSTFAASAVEFGSGAGYRAGDFAVTPNDKAVLTDTIDVPAWANLALVTNIVTMTVNQVGGSSYDIATVTAGAGGYTGAAMYSTVEPDDIAQVTATYHAIISVDGGSSIDVEARVHSGSANWSVSPWNVANLDATALFRRRPGT